MKFLKNIEFQADDFGYDPISTYFTYQLKKENKIINFCVMPNFFNRKKNWNNLIKDHKIAVHINLIEGKPILHPNKVPSLIDKQGNFYPAPIFIKRLFLGKINTKEIYQETEAQINLLKKKTAIIELNSHQHLHALSPIADIFSALAKKNKIRYIRSYKNISSMTIQAKIKYTGLKILAYFSELIFNKRLGLPSSWIIKDKKMTVFLSWEGKNFQFDQFKNKQCKIVIHPGLPFDNNKFYLQLWQK